MAIRYYISTEEASFFNSNSMGYAANIPTTGTYKVGDFIISSKQEDGIFGWVCTVAGTPGEWEVIGSGLSGGGNGNDGGNKIIGYYNVVEFTDARSNIEIGIDYYNKNEDFLEVHYNGLLLAEGIHYSISEDGRSINAIDGIWNENEDDTQAMIFRVLKSEGINVKKLSNVVEINNACYEVEMGIVGYNVGRDLLEVHLNGVLLAEGIDYTVENGKLVKVDKSEAWNPYNVNGQKMFITVFKNNAVAVEPTDGSVTIDKLSPDVAENMKALDGLIDIVDMQNVNINNLMNKVNELEDKVENVDFSEIESKIEEVEGKIDNFDISGKQDVSDNNLVTNNKTIVGAINELFQNANNGKQLIASAIGNDLITVNSTFKAMSEAILGLRRNTSAEDETDAREILYNMMIEDGYKTATSEMIVDELIEILDDDNAAIGNIKQIGCSDNNTVILMDNGSVYSIGSNAYGALGLGEGYTYEYSFNYVTNNVDRLYHGNGYTFIIKKDGSVWACGANGAGQLGLGDTNDRYTFTKLSITDVNRVICGGGGYHTFIIKNDGSLWACGYNNKGQLGLGDNTDRATFTQVTTNINNDVKQVACNGQHSFIIKIDGSLWCCGDNQYGQLGLNDNTDRATFTKVTTNINNDVKQVACGSTHTMIVKNDGTVWGCGENEEGELGISSTAQKTTFTQATTNVSDVKQISCGYNYTMMLKNDDRLWACGTNHWGQIGLRDSTENRTKLTFTLITSPVAKVYCGPTHSYIITNEGILQATGYDNYGQLGLGYSSTITYGYDDVEDMSAGVINEYETNRQKLYYYLLYNEIPVTEDMDIGTMLSLLVEGYINSMINQYVNNLRIVLADEGVTTTDEDDMDSLISKVDQEFTEKNNEIASKVTPAGTAVASDVISGKTFINSTGKTVTGTATISSLGGMQFASGNVNLSWNSENGSQTYTISGLTFTPKHFIICFSDLFLYERNGVNATFRNVHLFDNTRVSDSSGETYVYISNFSKTSFTIYGYHNEPSYGIENQSEGTIVAWYAFG